MMKKLIKAPLAGLITASLFLMGNANAGVELDQINATLKAKEAEISAKYNVILTTAELNDLKISLIVSKVRTDNIGKAAITVEEQAAMAIEIYQIDDTYYQRKLNVAFFGGGGVQPPQ
jgi:demethoxyubiquinone hydroxylase (CLK1/Coq7/Cat5 family)